MRGGRLCYNKSLCDLHGCVSFCREHALESLRRVLELIQDKDVTLVGSNAMKVNSDISEITFTYVTVMVDVHDNHIVEGHKFLYDRSFGGLTSFRTYRDREGILHWEDYQWDNMRYGQVSEFLSEKIQNIFENVDTTVVEGLSYGIEITIPNTLDQTNHVEHVLIHDTKIFCCAQELVGKFCTSCGMPKTDARDVQISSGATIHDLQKEPIDLIGVFDKHVLFPDEISEEVRNDYRDLRVNTISSDMKLKLFTHLNAGQVIDMQGIYNRPRPANLLETVLESVRHLLNIITENNVRLVGNNGDQSLSEISQVISQARVFHSNRRGRRLYDINENKVSMARMDRSGVWGWYFHKLFKHDCGYGKELFVNRSIHDLKEMLMGAKHECCYRIEMLLQNPLNHAVTRVLSDYEAETFDLTGVSTETKALAELPGFASQDSSVLRLEAVINFNVEQLVAIRESQKQSEEQHTYTYQPLSFPRPNYFKTLQDIMDGSFEGWSRS